jgi:hypothetical protein
MRQRCSIELLVALIVSSVFSANAAIRQNCVRGHVITLQPVHNGNEDRRARDCDNPADT